MAASTTLLLQASGVQDAELLAEIICTAWTDEARTLGLTEERVPRFPAWATAESVRHWITEHSISMYLLLDGGNPVACGGHSPDAEHPGKGWLNRVSVGPEYQGRGYGHALVGLIEDRMRAEGYTRVRLGHVACNARLHRFYEGLGYETIETQYADSWLLDITYMEKDL